MALAATTVMNLPLGTVYAFSVFLGPLEAELAVTRAELSFVFGFALVAFTAGMNLAPMLYRLAPAWMLVAGAAAVASLGIVLAASASGIGQLVVGYGVLFGLGGGAVYVLLLQGVNLMLDGRQGLVNGFIVSLYPAGAMIGAPLFGLALSHWGLRATLGGLATTLAVAGAVAAWLVVVSGLTVVAPVTRQAAAGERKVSIFLRLWVVFFLAAAAGLTVLGQAAGMVVAYGGSMALALFTTTAVTGCIAAARIGGGWLADRFPTPVVMAGAHAFALSGDLLLLAFPGPLMSAATLAMIGLGYGIVSGSTAAAITMYWGAAQYGRMAGRLYIAWCAAAVTLPVLAGRLFDLSGGYAGAIIIAAVGNALGIAVALWLPRPAARKAGSVAPGT